MLHTHDIEPLKTEKQKNDIKAIPGIRPFAPSAIFTAFIKPIVKAAHSKAPSNGTDTKSPRKLCVLYPGIRKGSYKKAIIKIIDSSNSLSLGDSIPLLISSNRPTKDVSTIIALANLISVEDTTTSVNRRPFRTASPKAAANRAPPSREAFSLDIPCLPEASVAYFALVNHSMAHSISMPQ